MPGGGKLVVSTENLTLESPFVGTRADHPPGPLRDACGSSTTGCGMDEEILSRIFEPFFTTKETGQGDGARPGHGVRDREAERRIHPRRRAHPGRGTTFTVYLPGRREDGAGNDGGTAGARGRGESAGEETILLVEDEDMVRELAVEIFQGNGYTVLRRPERRRRARDQRPPRRPHRPAGHRPGHAGNERHRAGRKGVGFAGRASPSFTCRDTRKTPGNIWAGWARDGPSSRSRSRRRRFPGRRGRLLADPGVTPGAHRP